MTVELFVWKDINHNHTYKFSKKLYWRNYQHGDVAKLRGYVGQLSGSGNLY